METTAIVTLGMRANASAMSPWRRIAAAARDTVLTPAGREIAQYERFRKDLAVAEASRQT